MAKRKKSDRGLQYREELSKGLYDQARVVRQNPIARKLAKEAAERLKELYLNNPKPLDDIASYHLKIYLKKLKDGETPILSSYAGYAKVKMAYPEFDFDHRMFLTDKERESFEKANKNLGTNILKDFQIEMIKKCGNTIVSRKYSPEQIKKEVKRRLNLKVEVSSFRITPDNFFWIVETLEIFKLTEVKRTTSKQNF